MADGIVTTCSACGKRLKVKAESVGKRVKCACGLTFTASAGGGGGAVAGGRGPAANTKAARQAAADKEERSALIKQLFIGIAVLIVVVGAVVGIKQFGGSKANAAPSKGEDAVVEEMIAEQNGTEARQWLKEGRGRMFSGMTEAQANGYIDRWEKMGVKKVYAFAGVMTRHIAFELPADPAQRAEIFKWANEWNAESFLPKVPDEGQKYFLVHLKL